MGYIQVQFYQNDFNNNYCGGVARADKVKQMLAKMMLKIIIVGMWQGLTSKQ